MTVKPTTYNLTPEFFTHNRRHLTQRKAELLEQMKTVDKQIAWLDEDEKRAAKIAERYPEVAKAKRPNTGRPYKPKENVRIMAAKRGELEPLAEALGRDYPGVMKQHEVLLKRRKPGKTPKIIGAVRDEQPDAYNEAARVMSEKEQTTNSPRAAEADELRSGQSDAAFTPDADPSVSGSAREAPSDSGIGGRGEPVRRTHRLPYNTGPSTPFQEPEPDWQKEIESQEPDMTNPGFRQSSKEVTARDSEAARELAEFDARRQRMPRAKPGIPVRGLTNDGPGHERFLDPEAFASRRSD